MLQTYSTTQYRQSLPSDRPEREPFVDFPIPSRPVHPATATVRMVLGDRVTAEECQALARAVMAIVPVRNGSTISAAFGGDRHLHLIVEGWAYRAHGLHDGVRQITNILVAGDMCNWVPPAANEDIRACGPVRVAVLRRTADNDDRPSFHRYRERTMVDDMRRLRAQLTSLGRRNARERVAYHLADVHDRSNKAGLAKDGAFACPLTQEQLADLLGLTPVHVNRVLQGLRRDGLLVCGRRRIALPDLERLHAVAGWGADVIEADAAMGARPILLPPR